MIGTDDTLNQIVPGSEVLTDNDVILVTGGTGLFGKGIEEVVKHQKLKGRWVFAGSKEGDLRKVDECEALFERVRPTYVLHLAAFVGGLFRNMSYKVDFWLDNVNMNNNVLQCCHKYDVKKTISCLSTCIFPDKVSYPIHEDVLHNGPPHFSNDAYAYAKRMLDMSSRWFNEQYYKGQPIRFTSVIPTNLYGLHDNFNVANGHVLPGLIHKCYNAKQKGEDFVVYGSGAPLRQFLYHTDAARMMLWALFNYQDQEPVIISVGEEDEISIGDAAKVIAEEFDYNKIVFDTSKADGQFKKTASNDKFMKLNPDFKFTPFREGVRKTIQWFIENYDTQVRK